MAKIITSNTKLIVLKLMINKISPNKFKVKGPPKFAIHKRNQNEDIIGNRFKFALFNMILREWERSYIMFAHENMPEEQIPCANIIIILPRILQKFFDRILIIINAIWTTEEYAIITFISLFIKHTILKNDPPKREKIITNRIKFSFLINRINRIKPYPPNFNKTPAKIIEPPTGASTWAFGSHWWKKNIGNFTKNDISIIKIYKLYLFIKTIVLIKVIDKLKFKFIKIIINANRGKEAKRVYKSR